MLRIATAALWSLLNKPLFGTHVIPRDASVDPTLFPEQEYPVYCSKCTYLLRGLPDGKCPECGTSFERGKLLVRTYVSAWSGALWRDSAARKWFWWLLATGIALPFLASLGFVCMKYFGSFNSPNPPSSAALDSAFRLVYALLGVMFVGPVLQLVALAIVVKAYPRGSWKRRRAIIDAISEAESATTSELEHFPFS